MGAVLPFLSAPLTAEVLRLVARKFDPLLREIRQLGSFGGVLVILGNNLRAAAFIILTGLTLVLPLLAIFSNGMLVGLLATEGDLAGHLPLGRFVLAILPHGIFELPALFLASALGLRLGLAFWRKVLTAGAEPSERLTVDLARLGAVLLCLLVAASLIEVYVSAALSPARPF